MTATLVLAAICCGGILFLIRFLIGLHQEGGGQAPRVERILPHSIIDWDVDVEESPSPGVKHAIPRNERAKGRSQELRWTPSPQYRSNGSR